MPYCCTLIPGDGIGPEVSEATVRAIQATGVDICWRRAELNEAIILEAGKTLPQYLLDSLHETRVGLKGPVTTPIAEGFQSVPIKTLPSIKTRFQDVQIDMIIFRENTEDLYSGLEHEIVKDVVTSLKVITRTASERIARYAFSYARKNGRRQVTAIHKANIMKLADGLFLRCAREVSKAYPEIQ